MTIDLAISMIEDAPIPTWYRVGGTAECLAFPASEQQLAACLEDEPNANILGDGANLLVDDEGIDGLVISLRSLNEVSLDPATGFVTVGAGIKLPRLVLDTVRAGLAGLQGLGGIPATIGGATAMNAGGRYGSFGDCITRVWGVTRDGRPEPVEIPRDDIDFGYRNATFAGVDPVITRVELKLTPGNPEALRSELKSIMTAKAESQPLGAKSAGCAFKNPVLDRDLGEFGASGSQVPAGKLIERAGCKGIRVGSAQVSPRHANFITIAPDARHDAPPRARDIIDLMEIVAARVYDRFGVSLEREVKVWRRSS